MQYLRPSFNKTNLTKSNYLLVEDDEIDTLITSKMISHINSSLHPLKYTDGKAAIKYIEKCIEENHVIPEFILLDLFMPLYDGFYFLSDYNEKFHSKLPDIPVIVLSSSIDVRDRKKCLSYSFVKGYLEKPFNNSEFNSCITSTMNINFDIKI